MSVISELLDAFNGLVDYNYEKIEAIKRQYGIVKKVFDNTVTGKVLVKIRNLESTDDDVKDDDSDREKREKEKKLLTLMNKTGEPLDVGDHVWIYYWRTITDGYVAIKIGASKRRIELDMERGMTVCGSDDTIKKISENRHYFELQNSLSYGYDVLPELIYVGGVAAVYYPTLSDIPRRYNGNLEGTADGISFVQGLNSDLFTSEIGSTKYTLSYIDRIDNHWYYRPSGAGGGEYVYEDWNYAKYVWFDTIDKALNGGMIIIYDWIDFTSDSYGKVHGVMFSKSFEPGIRIQSGASEYLYLKSNVMEFPFASDIERQFARHKLSRVEEKPY